MRLTLSQIENAPLNSLKEIRLYEELTTFPEAIYKQKDSLELLDLSNNKLNSLPEDIHLFSKLKICFFSNNLFVEFPKQLSKCKNLTMIGFKSNQISDIPEDSFPPTLQWLILTDNKISKLPKSIGDCLYLQKCGLAGNLISVLPDEMKRCSRLELIRISANKLTEIPEWLLKLPRLSWLAFSGNPCSDSIHKTHSVSEISWNEIQVENLLGEGASGFIFKAKHTVLGACALKIFKGEVTSDGYPEDELNTCLSTGGHPNIVPLFGELIEHPEDKKGIVMHLIPKTYVALGNPPSFSTCTRDVFDPNLEFQFNQGLAIIKNIAKASLHLHSRRILHGDLYAHNTLYNPEGDAYLGDFGAASHYSGINYPALIERIDVRAFGCLVEDVSVRIHSLSTNQKTLFQELIAMCMDENVAVRPNFETILNHLEDIK
jgi:tRNA A-37 threonylcarbamoyl transferase component Bud32